MNDFEKALNKLPDSAGYDMFSHKTIEDLCWICLHELDLVAEKEYWLPKTEIKKLYRFIQKYGYYLNEATEVYPLALLVKKSDCYICD